jgi:hypothetical protein
MVLNKKKEIDLKQIRNLYFKAVDRLSLIHLNVPKLRPYHYPRPLESIKEVEKIKEKFGELKERYNFNYFNESDFNEKVGRILDFERELRKEDIKTIAEKISSINKLIVEFNEFILNHRKNQFENSFKNEY